jgi:tRNA (guanine-N7-)-methyltransferase
MGKGQFIEKHSKNNPDTNYIGIEKYPSVQVIPVQRLERETTVEERNNLRFLSKDAEALKEFFAKEEVDKIYINFPDP